MCAVGSSYDGVRVWTIPYDDAYCPTCSWSSQALRVAMNGNDSSAGSSTILADVETLPVREQNEIQECLQV